MPGDEPELSAYEKLFIIKVVGIYSLFSVPSVAFSSCKHKCNCTKHKGQEGNEHCNLFHICFFYLNFKLGPHNNCGDHY